MTEENKLKPRISAFVICCNEERNISRCLESLRWCDEIVIVDSGSTDRTIEICKEFTSKILFRPWSGFVEQKRFGLEQCTGEWVLNVDADEEVSPELRDEILSAISHASSITGGFELLRVVFYLGKWWRRGGWYPEFRLRVLRRERARWGGDDPHEKAIVDGTVSRLCGELRHYTYANISEQVKSLNSHSSAAARSLALRGKRFTYGDISIRPLGRFFKFLFVKKGFLEGFPGVVVAFLESYYVFLKYIKLWEITREQHRSQTPREK